MQDKRITIQSLFLFLWCFCLLAGPLLAEEPYTLGPPDCKPESGPLTDAFVESGALNAWANCDMRCTGRPGPFHIQLIGDSVWRTINDANINGIIQ